MSLLTTIKGAQSALALTSEKGMPTPQPQAATPRFSHWSMYLLIGSSLAAAATAIAVSVMALYGFAVVSALLSISCAIGAFYIKRFAIIQGLDELIKLLSERIRELHTNIQSLGDTVKNLRSQREEDNKKREALQLDLGEKTKQLNVTVEKLNAQTSEFNKLETLYQQSKQTADKAFEKAQRYLEAESNMRDRTITLCKGNQKVMQDLQSIWDKTQELNKNKTGINQTIAEFNTSHVQWAKIVAQMTATCQAKDQLIAELSKNLSTFETTNKNLEQLLRDNSNKQADLKQLSATTKTQVDQDKETTNRINRVLTLLEEDE